jgi:hypothetical protein
VIKIAVVSAVHLLLLSLFIKLSASSSSALSAVAHFARKTGAYMTLAIPIDC